MLDTNQDATDDEAVDEPDGGRHSLGPRGGPCGDVAASEASDGASEDDNPLSMSLEAKYFSQSFQQDPEELDEGWTNCPDSMELEFQQGGLRIHLNTDISFNPSVYLFVVSGGAPIAVF